MVTFQSKQFVNTKEGPSPIMHKHSLLVKKDAPGGFNSGDTVLCFICQYDGGRYCVFTASFIRIDHYHVFDSEQELHDTFDENL
jgi:hypothetical protein